MSELVEQKEAVLSDFLEKIKSNCTMEGDCWLWNGRSNGENHPKLDDKSARRKVWAEVNGEIPKGMLITITCKDVSCLFHGHLKAVTRSSVSKAASTKVSRLKRARSCVAASRDRLGKINMEIARRIRDTVSPPVWKRVGPPAAHEKSLDQWAQELGISRSMVSKIRTNKAWIDYATPWVGLML